MADMTLAQLQALVEQQGAELAKLKAAAAATTPAPTEYYTLTKTGEEIDEILAGGGGVNDAVRYSAAQSLSDEQKTQARGNINAAPSGYGWGEEVPRRVSTAAEVDAIAANSVVRYANDSANLVDGDSNSYTRYAIVETYTVNTTDKAQDVYCYGGGAHGDVMLHRGRFGNTWLPWEWVNPPMVLGVEYRTTERYQGKPVYVKVMDCGACPAAGFKDVTFGERGVVVPVRCYGNFGYGGGTTIPFQSTETDAMQIGALINFIRIHTNGNDFSAYNCTATVYYTKTTD